MGSSLHTVKNQALIAMVERVFYSKFICGHDLFWRESFCWRFAFAILFYFQCILTTENLQLSCHKHNVVVSYIVARRINSLPLFIQSLYIRKISHFIP